MGIIWMVEKYIFRRKVALSQNQVYSQVGNKGEAFRSTFRNKKDSMSCPGNKSQQEVKEE